MGIQDLPVASGQRHVAAFQRAGWTVVRQSGSHVILGRAGVREHLSIPCHKVPLKRTLLAKLIKNAGLTYDEYVRFFKN